MNRSKIVESVAIVVLFLCGVKCVFGKIFTRCEVYDILWVHNIPREDIPFYICVAERTKLNSSYNNDPVMGMFSIHTGYWKAACKMSVADFVDDNIFDDIACAKFIFRVDKRDFGSGYSAFQSSWCEKDNAKFVDGCGDFKQNPAVVERIS